MIRLAAGLLLFALWPMGSAFARARTELPYPLDAAFSTAVRFLRIDKGCKILDQDPRAAYVTFACGEEGHRKQGSMELFKVEGGVRVQLSLGDETHGMELRWLDLFTRKLRDEQGTPPPPPAPPPTKGSSRDGGT